MSRDFTKIGRMQTTLDEILEEIINTLALRSMIFFCDGFGRGFVFSKISRKMEKLAEKEQTNLDDFSFFQHDFNV